MALAKPPLMPVPQAIATAEGPFKTLFDRAFAMERSGEALTVTVAGGFAYADVPEAGVGLLVTTDDDPAAARRLADELATLAWSLRHDMIVRNTPPAEAVAEAIAFPEGPVMLVDVGDNIGGGTPGDGTVLLAELLAQEAQEATVVIADAEAARAAFAAGVGATVRLAVGGKTDCSAWRPGARSRGGCASSAMGSGCTRGRRTRVSRSTWVRPRSCAVAG